MLQQHRTHNHSSSSSGNLNNLSNSGSSSGGRGRQAQPSPTRGYYNREYESDRASPTNIPTNMNTNMALSHSPLRDRDRDRDINSSINNNNNSRDRDMSRDMSRDRGSGPRSGSRQSYQFARSRSSPQPHNRHNARGGAYSQSRGLERRGSASPSASPSRYRSDYSRFQHDEQEAAQVQAQEQQQQEVHLSTQSDIGLSHNLVGGMMISSLGSMGSMNNLGMQSERRAMSTVGASSGIRTSRSAGKLNVKDLANRFSQSAPTQGAGFRPSWMKKANAKKVSNANGSTSGGASGSVSGAPTEADAAGHPHVQSHPQISEEKRSGRKEREREHEREQHREQDAHQHAQQPQPQKNHTQAQAQAQVEMKRVSSTISESSSTSRGVLQKAHFWREQAGAGGGGSGSSGNGSGMKSQAQYQYQSKKQSSSSQRVSPRRERRPSPLLVRPGSSNDSGQSQKQSQKVSSRQIERRPSPLVIRNSNNESQDTGNGRISPRRERRPSPLIVRQQQQQQQHTNDTSRSSRNSPRRERRPSPLVRPQLGMTMNESGSAGSGGSGSRVSPRRERRPSPLLRPNNLNRESGSGGNKNSQSQNQNQRVSPTRKRSVVTPRVKNKSPTRFSKVDQRGNERGDENENNNNNVAPLKVTPSSPTRLHVPGRTSSKSPSRRRRAADRLQRLSPPRRQHLQSNRSPSPSPAISPTRGETRGGREQERRSSLSPSRSKIRDSVLRVSVSPRRKGSRSNNNNDGGGGTRRRSVSPRRQKLNDTRRTQFDKGKVVNRDKDNDREASPSPADVGTSTRVVSPRRQRLSDTRRKLFSEENGNGEDQNKGQGKGDKVTQGNVRNRTSTEGSFQQIAQKFSRSDGLDHGRDRGHDRGPNQVDPVSRRGNISRADLREDSVQEQHQDDKVSDEGQGYADNSQSGSHFWKDQMSRHKSSRSKVGNKLMVQKQQHQQAVEMNNKAHVESQNRSSKRVQRQAPRQAPIENVEDKEEDQDYAPSRDAEVQQRSSKEMEKKSETRRGGVSQKAQFWISQQQNRPSPVKATRRQNQHGAVNEGTSIPLAEREISMEEEEDRGTNAEQSFPGDNKAPTGTQGIHHASGAEEKGGSATNEIDVSVGYQSQYLQYMSRNRERKPSRNPNISSSFNDESIEISAKEREDMRKSIGRHHTTSVQKKKVRNWPPVQEELPVKDMRLSPDVGPEDGNENLGNTLRNRDEELHPKTSRVHESGSYQQRSEKRINPWPPLAEKHSPEDSVDKNVGESIDEHDIRLSSMNQAIHSSTSQARDNEKKSNRVETSYRGKSYVPPSRSSWPPSRETEREDSEFHEVSSEGIDARSNSVNGRNAGKKSNLRAPARDIRHEDPLPPKDDVKQRRPVESTTEGQKPRRPPVRESHRAWPPEREDDTSEGKFVAKATAALLRKATAPMNTSPTINHEVVVTREDASNLNATIARQDLSENHRQNIELRNDSCQSPSRLAQLFSCSTPAQSRQNNQQQGTLDHSLPTSDNRKYQQSHVNNQAKASKNIEMVDTSERVRKTGTERQRMHMNSHTSNARSIPKPTTRPLHENRQLHLDTEQEIQTRKYGMRATHESKPVNTAMNKLQQYNRIVKSQVEAPVKTDTPEDSTRKRDAIKKSMTPFSTDTTLSATIGSSLNESENETSIWATPQRNDHSYEKEYRKSSNNAPQDQGCDDALSVITDTSAILPVSEVKRRLWDDGEKLKSQKDDQCDVSRTASIKDEKESSTFKSRYYRAAEVAQKNSGGRPISRSNSMQETSKERGKETKSRAKTPTHRPSNQFGFTKARPKVDKNKSHDNYHAQLVEKLSSVRRDDPNALTVIDSILSRERKNLAIESPPRGKIEQKTEEKSTRIIPTKKEEPVPMQQRFNFAVDEDISEYTDSDSDDSTVSSITNPTYMSSFDSSLSHSRKHRGRVSPSACPPTKPFKKHNQPTRHPSYTTPLKPKRRNPLALKPSPRDPSVLQQQPSLPPWRKDKVTSLNESFESEGQNTLDTMVSPPIVQRKCNSPANMPGERNNYQNTQPHQSPVKALKAKGSSTNNRGLLSRIQDWNEDNTVEDGTLEVDEAVDYRPGTPSSPTERLKRLANAANKVDTQKKQDMRRNEESTNEQITSGPQSRRVMYPLSKKNGVRNTVSRPSKGRKSPDQWESVSNNNNFFETDNFFRHKSGTGTTSNALSDSVTDAFADVDVTFDSFTNSQASANQELTRKFSRVEESVYQN